MEESHRRWKINILSDKVVVCFKWFILLLHQLLSTHHKYFFCCILPVNFSQLAPLFFFPLQLVSLCAYHHICLFSLLSLPSLLVFCLSVHCALIHLCLWQVTLVRLLFFQFQHRNFAPTHPSLLICCYSRSFLCLFLRFFYSACIARLHT